jgi:hypothetical protein
MIAISPSTTNNDYWLLAVVDCVAAVMAVVNNGGSGGIEPMVLMAASSTVAAVDAGSNVGVFTTASHDNNHHPCPHHPRPCPPLDKDLMAGWRARRNASHLLLPQSLLLAPSLSPLTG